MFIRLTLIFCLACSLATAQTASNQIYIKLHPKLIDVALENIQKIGPQLGITKIEPVFKTAQHRKAHQNYNLHQWYLVQFEDTLSSGTAKLIERFRNMPNVLSAEPVYKMQQDLDPRFPEQWHYHNSENVGKDIHLLKAWEIEKGNKNVIVAVIDGGIQTDHEDLKDNLWRNILELNGQANFDDDNNGYIDDIHGWNFAQNSSKVNPHPHGTHVGGTVGAVQNEIGVAGVASVSLMSCQVFDQNDTQGGFAQAFIYAADNGAVVAQNSWNGGAQSEILESAIRYFIERAGMDNSDQNFNQNLQIGPMAGGIVIFSAGNENSSSQKVNYPSGLDYVIAVAATDQNDQKAQFSSHGEWVDIAAPGVEVLSTTIGNSYMLMSGTSMAAPHVSGVAALLISKHQKTGLKPDMIRAALLNGVDNIDALNYNWKGLLGSGRLNAYKALLSSLPPTIEPAQFSLYLETERLYVQHLTLKNPNDTTISIQLKSDATWLTVDQKGKSMQSAETLVENILIDTRGMLAGHYAATITIEPFKIQVPVQIVVTGIPDLITIDTLDFRRNFQFQTAQHSFEMENPGTDTLFFQIISKNPNIRVSPKQGLILPQERAHAYIAWREDSIGTYSSVIEVHHNATSEIHTIYLINEILKKPIVVPDSTNESEPEPEPQIPNQAPIVTAQQIDFTMQVADTLFLDLTQMFQDPEGRQLEFEFESHEKIDAELHDSILQIIALDSGQIHLPISALDSTQQAHLTLDLTITPRPEKPIQLKFVRLADVQLELFEAVTIPLQYDIQEIIEGDSEVARVHFQQNLFNIEALKVDTTTFTLKISDTLFYQQFVEVLAPLGIEEFENPYSLYPNPTSNYVILKYAKGAEYVIWNAIGSIIDSGIIEHDEFQIRIQAPSGIYFLKLNHKEQTNTFRIIKN